MTHKNTYSLLDRSLHKIAFFTKAQQAALAEMEDALYKQELEKTPLFKPVFITGLPRSGTTLILDILAKHPSFGFHTYRNMPFIMLPIIWDKLSSYFSVSPPPMDRAHGDGMKIEMDSPEAFEEMIWYFFWPENYQPNRITPWSKNNNTEFKNFFSSHMRKLVWLRSKKTNHPQIRYLSKNNTNIARIDYLKDSFPDSIIIIPFRNPISHAYSLLTQHINFTTLHRQDDFSRIYMKEIGHFDFGENFLPIDFDCWLNQSQYKNFDTINFWLEYWIASHQHLLSKINGTIYAVPYEVFCKSGQHSISKLCELTETKPGNIIKITQINNPKNHSIPTGGLDISLAEKANSIYDLLIGKSPYNDQF